MSFEIPFGKIDKLITAGKKARAAERLHCLIHNYPNEIIVREKLAELYFSSGFLDAAGRYWMLTKSVNSDVIDCIKIYRESVNNSATQILKDIKFRGDRGKISAYAKGVLEELEQQKQADGGGMKQYNSHKQPAIPEKPSTSLYKIGPIVLFVLFIIIVITGVYHVISWIGNLIEG